MVIGPKFQHGIFIFPKTFFINFGLDSRTVSFFQFLKAAGFFINCSKTVTAHHQVINTGEAEFTTSTSGMNLFRLLYLVVVAVGGAVGRSETGIESMASIAAAAGPSAANLTVHEHRAPVLSLSDFVDSHTTDGYRTAVKVADKFNAAFNYPAFKECPATFLATQDYIDSFAK